MQKIERTPRKARRPNNTVVIFHHVLFRAGPLQVRRSGGCRRGGAALVHGNTPCFHARTSTSKGLHKTWLHCAASGLHPSNLQQPTQCYDHHFQLGPVFFRIAFVLVRLACSYRLSAGFVAAKHGATAAAEADDAALDMQLNFVSV